MKNKLFFSSLIIIGMITAGMNSALALSQDIGFTVPGSLSLERNSSSVLAATATISDAQTLTLDNPITFTYDVTNADSEERSVLLSVTNVLYDGEEPYQNISELEKPTTSFILFSNDGGSQLPTNWNFTEQNRAWKNIIGFPFECTEANRNHNHSLIYTLDAGTTKTITCTISGTADSFRMNDEPGTYKATVSITNLLE